MSFSTQLQRALDFLAFIDTRDYQGIANATSENFTHVILPESLGGLGNPSRNKQEFIDMIKGLDGIVGRIGFQQPKEVVESGNFLVLHLSTSGELLLTGKPYTNEFMFIIQFENDKILSIKEFVDSKYVVDTFGGLHSGQ
ncbi:hypothetical protein K439DRAFT_1662048 [Ramaria rubella]|nr:hypothetical protein K439DRAFT_1662048 [Ramaria rubella]